MSLMAINQNESEGANGSLHACLFLSPDNKAFHHFTWLHYARVSQKLHYRGRVIGREDQGLRYSPSRYGHASRFSASATRSVPQSSNIIFLSKQTNAPASDLDKNSQVVTAGTVVVKPAD
jgi:hypothetical protein